MQELSLHNFLSTMRLTDFLADLMSIKNYQRLLLNKAKKYQIKQLRECSHPPDASRRNNGSVLDDRSLFIEDNINSDGGEGDLQFREMT